MPRNGVRPYAANFFIGGAGALLLICAVIGYFLHFNAEATIAVALFGCILAVVGAVVHRIEGPFKLTKEGVDMNLLKAESDVQHGRLKPAGTVLPELPAAIRPESGSEKPQVFITEEALKQLDQLDPSRRQALKDVLQVARRSYDPQVVSKMADSRVIVGGRPHFVRDLEFKSGERGRLRYRQLDKTSETEPDAYVLLDLYVSRPRTV
jgi:mRNA-degrading endonuclease RelE of RelBE toxin-antitoxin system